MARVVDAVVAPLDVAQVAERFERIAAMIDADRPGAARRELAGLVAAADDETASLLLRCLQALERPRAIAVPLLRRVWLDATPDARELVEACVPRGDAPRPLVVPAQRPAAPARGPVSVPVTRQGQASGARDPRVAGQARDAARYFAQDAAAGGIDALSDDDADDGQGSDYPGGPVDEAAALVPVSGTLCVSCWTERPTREQRRADDDGLCECCRERGERGVVTPAGADRAGRITARVAHIAARAASTDAARSLLRGEWRRARGADKRVIVDWVDHHLPT